jgi:hypothetical protein
MKFLLAAEADQIQDYILRSSKLQELMGASDLLSSFCHEAPEILKNRYPDMQILVNDAGTFRLTFLDKAQAEEAGRDLAELYLQVMGSSISVSDGIPIVETDGFTGAMEKVRTSLQQAKRGKGKVALSAHVPWVAFCHSCGTGLSQFIISDGDDGKIYLCATCKAKREWRGRVKSKDGNAITLKESGTGFLHDYYKVLKQLYDGKLNMDNLKLPISSENKGHREDVAYLVADANGAGMLFDSCENEKSLIELSRACRIALASALAKPCAKIIKASENSADFIKQCKLPIMPFIMGGDDCFAKIPAYCSLDVAAMFCEEFYNQIKTFSNGSAISTVGVAVVICKENYPYHLAYKFAHDLLDKAKIAAKRVTYYAEQPVSGVNFAVISSNSSLNYDNLYRGTLRPYFIPHSKFLDRSNGQHLKELLAESQKLRKSRFPATRLYDLRTLYDVTRLNSLEGKDLAQWDRELELKLQRIERKPEHRKVLVSVLTELGDTKGGYWRRLGGFAGEPFYKANGIADLIEMWDYCYSVSDCPWEDDQ